MHGWQRGAREGGDTSFGDHQARRVESKTRVGGGDNPELLGAAAAAAAEALKTAYLPVKIRISFSSILRTLTKVRPTFGLADADAPLRAVHSIVTMPAA